MLKRKLFLFLVAILSITSINAQDYHVKGYLTDTLDNSLISATVLLLDSDSTMVDFTRSELDGSFVFKDIKGGDYIVKTTYIGFIPLSTPIVLDKDLDLGNLKMVEMNEKLMEIVIKAAKAPIKMRGDTMEYDATQFKVPEGSTVEELLAQLPGIELDVDGKIRSDGKDVTKVTVDGKKFFGDDPTMATKNLPAEGIAKVQVFDKKTEEEEVTGVKKESSEKTMNLELKEGFRSGGFGKITAGYGSKDRAGLRGNFNRFNDKIQFSLIGSASNTHNDGLSFNEYREFRGSNSFNFSSNDSYGFGNSFQRVFYFGGSGGDFDIESSIRSLFFEYGGSQGYPEKYSGGINLNYSEGKSDISTVYFYKNDHLDKTTNTITRKYFDDFNTESDSDRDNINDVEAHRIEFTYDLEIDSLHSVKLEINGGLAQQRDVLNFSNQLVSNEVQNNLTNIEKEDYDGKLLNSILFFRKKFKKKGRRMGANVAYLTTRLERDQVIDSDNEFYRDGVLRSTVNNDQNINLDQDKNQIKVNAIYVEPLGKKFTIQPFFNFSNTDESGLRTVIDGLDRSLNDELSVDYSNNISYRRLGSSLRYSYKGFNAAVGLGYQHFDLHGEFNNPSESIIGDIDRTFDAFIPYLNMTFSPVRNSWVDMSYVKNINEPSIFQLQPIVDNTNPLYITKGNPGLTPQSSHSFSAYASRNYSVKEIRFNFGGSFDIFDNNIINVESVDDNLVTTVTYENFDEGKKFDSWMGFSFPIVKRLLTVRTNLNLDWRWDYAKVNSILNETRSRSYAPSVNVTWKPQSKINISLRSRWNRGFTDYSINNTQDQNTRSDNYSITVKTPVILGVYLNTRYNLQINRNDRYGIDNDIPIFNASLYKQFLKDKKMELRLSAFDILNKNLPFSQYANANQFVSSSSNAIGRYVMMSLTYNIRGLKLDSDSRW